MSSKSSNPSPLVDTHLKRMTYFLLPLFIPGLQEARARTSEIRVFGREHTLRTIAKYTSLIYLFDRKFDRYPKTLSGPPRGRFRWTRSSCGKRGRNAQAHAPQSAHNGKLIIGAPNHVDFPLGHAAPKTLRHNHMWRARTHEHAHTQAPTLYKTLSV